MTEAVRGGAGAPPGGEEGVSPELAAARRLAEAFETGAPLAPLPGGLLPRTRREGETIAALTAEALGLVACGVRVRPGPGGEAVAGPVPPARLLPDGAVVASATLRHPRITAAVAAVLAADLAPDDAPDDAAPAYARLYPALDLAATRLRDPPGTAALSAADLGELGLLVLGRPVEPPGATASGAVPWDVLSGTVPVRLGPPGRRAAGVGVDLAAALAGAAGHARRLGGLPAGALLVAAGLTPPVVPGGEGALAASFGRLGRVRVLFA